MTNCQQTELSQLQQENKALKERIDQMQRLTALGELVSTTTHEFNNVLMTILNYAKMGSRHKDDETRDKAFTKILAASERATKITNSVLGMARNRSNKFEPTDLPKLIDETMVLLEREMSKYRIMIDMQLDNVPKANVIGNQIQQVLLNLLINARQAMTDGGQIVIALQQNESQFVELSVRDYGTGIPEDKLRQIFKPYYSTKDGPDASGKGGTGLGLAACRNIIEAHGGKIRVESAVGQGTRFVLKLPVKQSVKSPVMATRGVAGAVSQMNASMS